MARRQLRTCPNCSKQVLSFSQLFVAALGHVRFRCPNCSKTVKLRIGTGVDFLLTFANEAFLLIAILTGLAAGSWTVFFVVLLVPVTVYCAACAKFCQVVVHVPKDA